MTKVSYCLKCFAVSFIIAILIMLPEIIQHQGVFVYAGDYYAQQIPFNYHAVEYLCSGYTGWDWNTDLGTDFIGSYSFYLLGSPFFWLLFLFGKELTLYLIPVMIALKTAVAALTSFIYIRRYVKKDICCFIGAVMYAFSGFQMFNLVYNHFHDVTALFPLLLLSFDMLVTENKRGFFAVMTVLAALTNYFFFVGEVIFILIYYIVRCLCKDFKFSPKDFFTVFTEAVIGIAAAAVILVPSFFAVTDIGRSSDYLSGTDLVSYKDNSIIPKIFQSVFIIPDSPSRAQLFQSEFNPINWASISLYLPLFASVGVAAYMVNNRKSYITRILAVSLIMASIPVLNSAFYLFNGTYYARWFYMPVLLMCAATARSLDEGYDLMPGIKFQSTGVIILAIIGILPGEVVDTDATALFAEESGVVKTVKWFGMSQVPVVFWQNIAFAVIFLLIIYVYNAKKASSVKSLKYLCFIMLGFVLVNGYQYINYTKGNIEIQNASQILKDDAPELKDDEFYRINILGTAKENLNLIWGEHTVGQFHSIVPGSVEDIYTSLTGKSRNMESRYTENDFPVYSLYSVKYILNESTGDDLNVELDPVDIPGFELEDKQGYFYIYKNQHFVPMGFTYDCFMTDEEIRNYIDNQELDSEEKNHYLQLALMRTAVLNETDAEKVSEYISRASDEILTNLTEETYFADCDAKVTDTCYNFRYDNSGFSAEYDSEKKSLLMFSVPVSRGWSAKVNGISSDIITAQYGFSAVCIEPGHNTIEFSYETPGLRCGKIISVSASVILVIYTVLFYTLKKNKSRGNNE